MITHTTELSDEEFRRVHEKPLTALRRLHPDRTEEKLLHALRQATGLTEPAGNARLIQAALFLLD
ncbi:hypothetical protein [Luteolibacter soli]|uniref:Uncharacterized protein n=1 Tax=Luteolibacter soli TaxID=3135280 RepID=A0ABU9B1R8_9BACT